jgi:GTP pyrophosphokinase
MADLGDSAPPSSIPPPEASTPKEVVDPSRLFAELKDTIRGYMPDARFDQLDQAYAYAADCHAPQKRKSGDPYIIHPIEVAKIIADLHLDLNSVIAALLHDTVEDTNATLDDIRERFGDQVAQLVDGLTKIAKIEFRSSQEKLAENFRKMIVAMAKDLRVILIKLADRLHNMRTLGHMPPEKGRRIAQETLDIYAPLANRLGIYGIKSELEDLCLRSLKNDVYRQLREKISQKKSQRQAYIDEVVQILDTALRKYGFKQVMVYGRPKHFYSIYKKMVDRRLQFEDLHDLFAFRIIVESVKDCYEALGVVHSMWKPMPGRFKDYIAMPKANMYQSLHTTVIRPNGEPIEIQIRTKEMHDICEYGVAAHWSYKEKTAVPGPDDLKKFSWLRQIVQWQTELKDPDEFLEAVRVDLFDEEIFVFTPRGDVISLPQSATALDFAFAVHTNIGIKTVGAKVNGRIVPIKKKLGSGDIVEIITSPNQQPSKDWVSFVVTSKARNKIRSALRAEQREKSKALGRELLQQELAKLNISNEELERSDRIEAFIKFGREAKLEDVLIAIGYGKLNPYELISRVFPESEQIRKAREASAKNTVDEKISKSSASKSTPQSVLVSGLDRVLVNFAKCCHPLPGEEIIGFITRGRGVSVHRANCARALDIDPHRKIDVSWSSQQAQSLHTGYIRVICRDEKGILAKVTETISSVGANIQKADIRTAPSDLTGILDFELGITGLNQLQTVINRIESLSAVVRVERRNVMKSGRTTKKGKG